MIIIVMYITNSDILDKLINKKWNLSSENSYPGLKPTEKAGDTSLESIELSYIQKFKHLKMSGLQPE